MPPGLAVGHAGAMGDESGGDRAGLMFWLGRRPLVVADVSGAVTDGGPQSHSGRRLSGSGACAMLSA